ncbi:MAG: hypothetical protein K9N35_03120 [Candidatus Marinimicrobia bacterium]|nr:hypothetical protein [Candidatus Neomarinimicrobiota bacterium]
MGYIPFKYLSDFFAFLARQDEIEVIAYSDFVHGDRNDESKWKKIRDPNKIYVVIQHDVDSQVQQTLDILQVQKEYQIRSNVMIFHRRVDRGLLKSSGELAYTEYLSDAQLLELKNFQDTAGIIIGYHSNAYEQALFDLDHAREIFTADLNALRHNFEVNYYSFHGGIRDSRGKSNEVLKQVDPELNVHWVHNGDPLKFAARFSDGGLASAPRRKGDLLRFVKKMKPGKRYQILIHPQYYSQNLIEDEANPTYKNLSRFDWFQQITAFYEQTPDGDYWKETVGR